METDLAAGAIAWYREPLTIHFIMAAAALWPLARILRRAGLSPTWAVLIAVPVLGPALIASALVFQRWPNRPASPARPRRRR